MKKLLLSFALLLSIKMVQAQSTGYIRNDTTKITNKTKTAQLVLELATKDTLGYLFNAGGGRVIFKTVAIPSLAPYAKLNGGNFFTGTQNVNGEVRSTVGANYGALSGPLFSAANGNYVNLIGSSGNLDINATSGVKILTSANNYAFGTNITRSDGAIALFSSGAQTINGNQTYNGTLTSNGVLISNGPFNTFGNNTFKAAGTLFEVQSSGYGLDAVNGTLGNSIGLQSPTSALQFGITTGGVLGVGLLKWDNVTASKTVQLPNASGTIALTSDITSAGSSKLNITDTINLARKIGNADMLQNSYRGNYMLLNSLSSQPTGLGSTGTVLTSVNNRFRYQNLSSGYYREIYSNYAGNGVYKLPNLSNSTLSDSTYISGQLALKLNKTDSVGTGGYQTIDNFFPKGDSRYVKLSGSYSNPTWITNLPYSKITGVPTAVSSFTNDVGYLTNTTGDARYPQLSLTYANPSWITNINYAKVASVPANSFLGNGTSSAASAASVPYFDSGEQTYTGSIAWTGTAAPSGTTSHTYQWVRIGKQVTVRISLVYSTVGTALTVVTADLPADLPAPHTVTGFAATDMNYMGWGGFTVSKTNSISAAGRPSLRQVSGAYRVTCAQTSGDYLIAHLNFVYYTD